MPAPVIVLLPAAMPAVVTGELMANATGTALQLALLLAAIAAAGVFVYRHLREGSQSRESPTDDLPPLVFPVTARPSKPRQHSADKPRQEAGAPPPLARKRAATAHSGTAADKTTAAPRKRGRAKANDATVTSETAGFADATLQIMPGRLEIVRGDAGTNEIRFVRPGGNEPVFTLGRRAGEAPTHVQLANPTVSRLHARLRYNNGDWHILNLSRTNPAVLNGQTLPVNGVERTLEDGDHLELGEIVMKFRRR